MEIRSEIIAVLLITLIGVIAIVTLEWMHPGKDNSSLITVILTFLGPTLAALIASIRTGKKVEEVNKQIDDLHVKADLIASTTTYPVNESAYSKTIPLPPGATADPPTGRIQTDEHEGT